eukprot:COSAG01_NODE_40284_length_465_cov_2.606557_2_plen_36_part_01
MSRAGVATTDGQGEEAYNVRRAFPAWSRAVLTEIYL